MLTVTGTASFTSVLKMGPSVRLSRGLVFGFDIFMFDFGKLARFLKQKGTTFNPKTRIRVVLISNVEY